MELNQDFIATVRPVRIYRVAGLSLQTVRGKYDVKVHDEPFMAATEYDLWTGVAVRSSTIFNEMLKDSHVSARALACRAEIMVARGAATIEAMEASLQGAIREMYETVVFALNGTRTTRAKLVARRARPSDNASYWKLSSNVAVPFEDKPVLINLAAFPNPVTPNEWAMSVSMPAPTNQVLADNMRHLQTAREILASKGIIIRDVLSGSYLAGGL
jgi:hypothetical protein